MSKKSPKRQHEGKKKQKNYGKFPFKENCQKLPFDEGGGGGGGRGVLP
jgi:hypothetical protein